MRRLVGGARTRRHSEPTSNSERRDHAAGSDQETVFDGDDSRTINTALSETSTLGDLRRNGYVNRCPHFTSERNIPFVSILLTKGFFCFPSEQSFAKFLENKRKFDKLDADGLGIPLFHAVPLGVVKTILHKNLPVVKIYKFVLLEEDEPPPEHSHELISTDGGRRLFKIEFCEVYKRMGGINWSRVEHKFVFHTDDLEQHEDRLFTVKMVNHVQRRHTDTRFDDLNLRWYGTTGFASPFGSGNFKLLVLDDNMPCLTDQLTDEDYERALRSHPIRTLAQLPVWANYSDETGTILPKKRTVRLANFMIGESENAGNSESDTSANGIRSVPWATQVMTCMCMVLHDYESRKDKRTLGTGYSSFNSALGVTAAMGSGLQF